MTGKNRNSISHLHFLLGHFPVVAIIGPRQAGKTTLAKQIAPDWKYFDLEKAHINILEGFFGIVPIEIKYGATVQMKKLTALREFVKEHKLLFGIVINQSDHITWLSEEIIQIPVGWI